MSNLGLNYFSNATIGRLQIGGSNQVLDLQTTSQLTINQQNRNDVLYQLIQDISGGGGGGGGQQFQDLSGVVYDLSADILTLTNEIADLSNNQTTTLTYNALQDRYTLEANANLLNGKDAIISIAYGDFNEIFVNGVYNKNGSDTMEIFGSVGETLLSLAKSAFGASKYVKYAKIGGAVAGGLVLGSVVASSVADLVGAFDTPPDTIDSTLLFGNALLGRLIYSSYDLYDTSLNLPLSNNNAIWNYVVCEDSHSDFYTLKLKDYANALDFSNNANKRPTQLQNSVKITGDNRLYSIAGTPYFNNHALISQDGTQIRIANSTLTNSGLEVFNNELYFNGVLIGSTNGDWRRNTTSGNIYSNVGVEINTNGALINQANDCLDVVGGNTNNKYISRFINTRLYLNSSSSYGSNDIFGIQLDTGRPSDYNSNVGVIYRYDGHLWFDEYQLDRQPSAKYVSVGGTTTTPNSIQVSNAYVVYTDDSGETRLCLMTDQNGGSTNSGLISKIYGGDLTFSNQPSTATNDLRHLTISTAGQVDICNNLIINNKNSSTYALTTVGGKTLLGGALEMGSNSITTTGTINSATINNSGSVYTDYNIVKTEIQMYNVDTSIGTISKGSFTYSGTTQRYISIGKTGSTTKAINVITSSGSTGATDFTGNVGICVEPDILNALTIRTNSATNNHLSLQYSATKSVEFVVDNSQYLNVLSGGNYFANKSDNGIYCGYYPSTGTGATWYLTTSTTSNNIAVFDISSTTKTRLKLQYETGGIARTYHLTNNGTSILSELMSSGMSYYLRRHNNTSVVDRYALTADHEWKDDTGNRLFYLSSSTREASFGSTTSYILIDGGNGTINSSADLIFARNSTAGFKIGYNSTYANTYVNVGTNLTTIPAKLQVDGYMGALALTAVGGSTAYIGYAYAGVNVIANANNINGWVPSIFASHDILGKVVGAWSDRRIKTNIKEIKDDEALEKVRLLKPSTYEYIDKINDGGSIVYGFIAQEVKEVLPYAVKPVPHFIPNIMFFGNITKENEIYVLTGEKDFVFDASGTNIIKIVSEKGDIFTVRRKSIISSKKIEIEKDKEDFNEAKYWIIGEEVSNFNALDKSAIFSVGISAIQEIDRRQQAQNDTIDALYNELHALIETHAKANIKLHDLEIENQFLKNKIIQLEQANYTNSQFETKLTALENKVNWLLAK